jgi:hypothetical protein
MFFTATDDKLGYIFFSTWLEKLSTRIWRSVILWLYESESLRLIIPVSSAAHVITSATMFPSSTQTLHRLLSDWDVLDYLVLIQFPRWQSIHCTQSRRDFTWTQIALICKYLPLTSIILLKVNWSKIYIITYRMHLKGALLPWFFSCFFTAVKRPPKLNHELSFETHSSHQKFQCSKNEAKHELKLWRGNHISRQKPKKVRKNEHTTCVLQHKFKAILSCSKAT